MSLASSLTELVLKPRRMADAHCDVPCGVYDPVEAKIAAQTVWSMTNKLLNLEGDGLERENTASRMIAVKEEHAHRCKEALWVLWTDYFKPEDVEKFPDLHEKFWKATKLCSTAKRGVDLDVAQQLKDAVDEIAGIFWQTPGAEAAAVVKP